MPSSIGCAKRTRILELAEKLAPALRQRAIEADKLRRMPDQTIVDLVDSRMHRVCQPARFGGYELPWDALCKIGLMLGRGDGSQAWVAVVYAAMGHMTALFEDQTQNEVWQGDGGALVAGSLVPSGNRVEKVAGGFRLTGSWTYTSGVHHAHWNILGEMAEGTDSGAGKREHMYFMVPASDYRIEDDWFAAGLAGTGSASVVLDNVFVPTYRTLLNRDVALGRSPGARVNLAPVYRMPMFGFAQQSLASVPIGVGLGMVEDFKSYLRAKLASPGAVQATLSAAGPAPWFASPPAAGFELLGARLAEASAGMHAASLLLLDAARTMMQQLESGATLGEADAAHSLRGSGYALKLVKDNAARMLEACGGQGLNLALPIQRGFRDVFAASNHASLGWDRSALRYGQFALRG